MNVRRLLAVITTIIIFVGLIICWFIGLTLLTLSLVNWVWGLWSVISLIVFVVTTIGLACLEEYKITAFLEKKMQKRMIIHGVSVGLGILILLGTIIALSIWFKEGSFSGKIILAIMVNFFIGIFIGTPLILFGAGGLTSKTSRGTKPSKPRDPWIEAPKVEKTEKKETKDDIPEIWKERVLGG